MPLGTWHLIFATGAITFPPYGLELPIVAIAMHHTRSVCVQANSMTAEVQRLHGKFQEDSVFQLAALQLANDHIGKTVEGCRAINACNQQQFSGAGVSHFSAKVIFCFATFEFISHLLINWPSAASKQNLLRKV